MTAENQRAYVARQKEKDPEGWRRRTANYGLRKSPRAVEQKRVRLQERPEIATQERASRRSWAERNPEKVRAHWAVNNALRSGRLQRPPSCQKCDATCKPQASHGDYSKPLEVEWLCQPCHKRKDARIQLEAT